MRVLLLSAVSSLTDQESAELESLKVEVKVEETSCVKRARAAAAAAACCSLETSSLEEVSLLKDSEPED